MTKLTKRFTRTLAVMLCLATLLLAFQPMAMASGLQDIFDFKTFLYYKNVLGFNVHFDIKDYGDNMVGFLSQMGW